MAQPSVGGDGIIHPKSCSFEQASTDSKSLRERKAFKGSRETVSWFTEKLQIEESEVLTEVLIKEDGKATMKGVLVESPVGSQDKTIYLVGDTTIEMKEALVILLDLCIDCLNCQHLAFAVERSKASEVLNDLKWVGFELVSPERVVKDKSIVDQYVFMAIDL